MALVVFAQEQQAYLADAARALFVPETVAAIVRVWVTTDHIDPLALLHVFDAYEFAPQLDVVALSLNVFHVVQPLTQTPVQCRISLRLLFPDTPPSTLFGELQALDLRPLTILPLPVQVDLYPYYRALLQCLSNGADIVDKKHVSWEDRRVMLPGRPAIWQRLWRHNLFLLLFL